MNQMLERAGYLALEDLDGGSILLRFRNVDHLHRVHLRGGLGVKHNSKINPFGWLRSPQRVLPTETKVESGRSHSKSGTYVNLRNSGLFVYKGPGVGIGD